MGKRKSRIDAKYAGPIIFVLAFFLAISALSFASANRGPRAKIEKHEFGKLADRTPIALYTLRNRNGLEVQITNYGGAVVSVRTPDRAGRMADIVLGYDQPQSYADDTVFFGVLVGRYANRIAKGKFSLKGRVSTGAEQSSKSFARRRPRFQQGHLAAARSEARRWSRTRTFLCEQRRRRGIPG
jgi:hypothetical protein